MNKNNKAVDVIINIFFIVLCAACIFPLLLTLSISLTEESTLYEYGSRRTCNVNVFVCDFKTGFQIQKCVFVFLVFHHAVRRRNCSDIFNKGKCTSYVKYSCRADYPGGNKRMECYGAEIVF